MVWRSSEIWTLQLIIELFSCVNRDEAIIPLYALKHPCLIGAIGTNGLTDIP